MQQALWRSVASRGAVGSKSCVPNTRATASESAPYPSPCAAEMKMVSGISRFTHPASSRWERSDLLMIAIQGRPWQAFSRRRSSSFKGSPASNTAKISWARSNRSRARVTPICSTGSSVSRRPAVSARCSNRLPRRTVSSTISRVVPA